MANLALSNPNIVDIIKPLDAKYDKWFYLQEYLSCVPTYTCVLSCGLGNRLFQFASAYGISKDRDVDFKLYNSLCRHNSHSTDINYNRFFGKFYDETKGRLKNPVWIKEPEFKINKFFIPKLDRDVVLKGYFQTDRYFNKYRDNILNVIVPTDEEVKYIIDKFGDLKDTMFIHVRMGDYLNDSMHFINFNEYYRRCIDSCDDTDFIVLTDDKSKCIELYPFLDKYQFALESEIISLFLMSLCNKGGICANSSFSWWGAWLNKNPEKKVFMPSLWFNDKRYTNEDIYFDNVTVINIHER